MAKVFIGVDPHKLSVTIEVVDDRETILTTDRFGTDKAQLGRDAHERRGVARADLGG
jgi:transposase